MGAGKRERGGHGGVSDIKSTLVFLVLVLNDKLIYIYTNIFILILLLGCMYSNLSLYILYGTAESGVVNC